MISSDESDFMKEVIVPFLADKWNEIDLPDPSTGWRDGRITLEELLRARESAMQRNNQADVFIFDALLVRYERLCQAFSDGYRLQDEPVMGISRQDVMNYTIKSSPNFSRPKNSRPRRR
ncbi:MAG: hypothetical protein K2W95_07220 [Candidatus Obscuribacterales bacterium]|nr:hypothetical protein [Candidatus Obscuribacterales bacterium]